MNSKTVEEALRSRGATVASLQPDPHGVAIALARGRDGKAPIARRRPLGGLAIALVSLLLAAAAASAATGLLGSALDSFFGGGSAPGRQLSQTEWPSWLQPAPGFNAPSEVSVVATDKGESLYAYRQGDSICFDYGHHVGECRNPTEWRRELEAQPWILRGPVGRSAWFGLVGDGIATVRVDYLRGEPNEVAVSDDGFVVVLDPARQPWRLVGLDGDGDEVTEQQIGD